MRGLLFVLLAAAAALLRPVETFVAAFVVLGPLHYLTELAWLRRRGFFVDVPAGRGALVATGVVAAALGVLSQGAAAVGTRAELQVLAVTALGTAVVLAGLLTRGHARTGLGITTTVVTCGLIGEAVGHSPWAEAAFVGIAVLLPTLVHVVLFTTLFMVHGWRAGRARHDLSTLLAYLACFALIGVARGAPAPALPGVAAAWDTMIGFLAVRLQDTATSWGVAPDHAAVAVPRLLAFAYAHHFLNWFDKTERVGWHRLPTGTLLGIGLAWAGFVGAYAWDVETGLLLVLLPNLLHVVMELPLNWRTATGLALAPPGGGPGDASRVPAS